MYHNCLVCNGRLFATSVWYRKWDKFPFSYMCMCTNKNCKKYLVKFEKTTKRLPKLI